MLLWLVCDNAFRGAASCAAARGGSFDAAERYEHAPLADCMAELAGLAASAVGPSPPVVYLRCSRATPARHAPPLPPTALTSFERVDLRGMNRRSPPPSLTPPCSRYDLGRTELWEALARPAVADARLRGDRAAAPLLRLWPAGCCAAQAAGESQVRVRVWEEGWPSSTGLDVHRGRLPINDLTSPPPLPPPPSGGLWWG